MSDKTIYWHIGLNKTGSTALEHFLSSNHEWVLKQDYTFFSKSLLYQHFWPLYYDAPFSKSQFVYLQELFQTIIDTKCTSNNILIIDEDLCLRNPFFEGYLIRFLPSIGTFHNSLATISNRLKHITKSYNLKLIIYLRRQDLFLESLYLHTLKTRHYFTMTFNDFKEKYDAKLLDWNIILSTVSSIIGKENIIVRIYEKNILENQNVICDFGSILGWPKIPEALLSNRSNVRLDSRYIEKIRAFNAIKLPLLPKYYFRVCPNSLCMEKSSKPYGFFTPESREKFLNKFTESNYAVASTYLNKPQLFTSEVNQNTDVIHQSTQATLSQEEQSFFKDAFYLPHYFSNKK